MLAPSDLGPVDEVRIVQLKKVAANRVSDFMEAAIDLPRQVVQGVEAERLVQLFRKVPPGEQARCHVPHYGLEFAHLGEVICSVSICWECNNIFGVARGVEVAFEFDGSASTSQELLHFIRKILGE